MSKIILLYSVLSYSIITTATAGTVEEVLAEARRIQSEPGLHSSLVGLCLIPLDGEPSAASGLLMDTGLVPASTMKVVTTATANEILGSDFRFTTELQVTGSVDAAGTLSGDVIIRGGGDPTLGESQIANTFSKWKSALTNAGIKKIEGAVVGDASIYGTKMLPDSWQWNDIGNYYGAGASGLTFHQNQFSCFFGTSSVGARASLIGTDPNLPGIQFINEMKVGTASSGDQGYIYGTPYGKIFYLRGSVPARGKTFTIKGSLPDPAYFCARGFTKYLNGNGVPVAGGPTTVRLQRIAGKSIPARKVIHTQTSESLASILMLTNQKSNNLRAECIHRMIGVKSSGGSTTKSASETTKKYWANKGINMTGFEMADGCGLSRANTVTPRQMTMMLYLAARHKNFKPFYNSLPVSGQSGTLRSIGKGTSAEGRIRAKSGTLDRIRNYAGYVTARSGKNYAFTLFVNNYTTDLSSVKSKIVRVWVKMAAL